MSNLKITLSIRPEPVSKKKLETCVPAIFKNKESGEQVVVIASMREALLFRGNGTITWSSISYIEEMFAFVREFGPGDSLSIKKE